MICLSLMCVLQPHILISSRLIIFTQPLFYSDSLKCSQSEKNAVIYFFKDLALICPTFVLIACALEDIFAKADEM